MSPDWPHGDYCLHVTPSVNRGSIAEHGLDWTRMGRVPGIASTPAPAGDVYRPQLPVVFLCGSWPEADFFTGFGQHPLVDVWEVDVRGLELDDAPDGWLLCRQPIPRERLRLVRRDVPPPRPEIITYDGENHLRLEIHRPKESSGGQPLG